MQPTTPTKNTGQVKRMQWFLSMLAVIVALLFLLFNVQMASERKKTVIKPTPKPTTKPTMTPTPTIQPAYIPYYSPTPVVVKEVILDTKVTHEVIEKEQPTSAQIDPSPSPTQPTWTPTPTPTKTICLIGICL